MKRPADVRSSGVGPQACCQFCEDDSFFDGAPHAVAILTIGPIWAAVDLVCCEDCLERVADGARFAIAKYGRTEGKVAP